MIQKIFTFSILVAFSNFPATSYGGKAEWGYSYDPQKILWLKQSKTCGEGRRQSPIAFWDDQVHVDPKLPGINFQNYGKTFSDLTVTNNGHTVQIDGFDKLSNSERPTITGGWLNSEYQLLQMHWHWGGESVLGSEHSFGNDFFPAELHMVHIKSGLTIDEALKDSTGLAVLGVFYEISDRETNSLTPITSQLSDVKYKDQTVDLSSLKPENFLPQDTTNMFTYLGSLTTPPCSEVVVWTVFTEATHINENQLQAFRNIETNKNSTKKEDEYDIDKNLLWNHRQVQPLSGRKVYSRHHKVGLPRHCSYEASSGISLKFSENLLILLVAAVSIFILR